MTAGVLLVAAVAVARAYLGWSVLGARFTPDLDLYAQGGVGLYPSPVGRLLGALGEDALAGVSILSAGAIHLLIGYRAGWRWSLFALLIPIGWLTVFVSVDNLAVALLLGGAFALGWGRYALLGGSVLVHFAVAPVAFLLLAGTVRVRYLACAAALAVGVAASTPYAPVLYRHSVEGFLVAFALTGALALVQLVPAVLRAARVMAVLGVVAVCAAEAGLQEHRQVRYVLPAAMLVFAGYGRRPVIR